MAAGHIMNIKVREMSVVLGVGLISLALGAGCETNRAKIESTQNPTAVNVFTNSPPPPTASPAPVVAAPVAAPIANPGTSAVATPIEPSSVASVTSTNAPVVQGPVVPEQMNLSPALTQVVKLIQGGVSQDVVMAYVTNSTDLFNIGSNEILYLHDLGTPAPVITALIQKDSTPEAQAKRQALSAGLAPSANPTSANPDTSGQPAVSSPPEPTPVAPPASTQVAAPGVTVTNVVVVQPQQPVSVSYFESELSPYGSWVHVSGYGRCWRPTVSVWNVGWRPYVDSGRWLWTDSGWYWYSDYSWGWAPFHYGRWFCPPGIGWVWYPEVTWGPAWVSWRHSGSHCGWAPLPPSAHWVHGRGFYHHSVSVGFVFEFGLGFSDYVFVSYDRFCDRRPGGYLVASHHARSVYGESKVVNNYVFKNNTIVNHGAGVEPVNAMTRGTVKKVALRDTPGFRDVGGRRERLESDGHSLAISRPSAAVLAGRTAAPTARPTDTTFSGSRFNSGSSAGPAVGSSSGAGGSIAPGGGARGNPNPSSAARPSTAIRREGADAAVPGRGNPGSNSRFERPYPRPATTTPPGGSSGSVGTPVTRPFTTRPSTREPSIVTGGSLPAAPIAPSVTSPGSSGTGSATVSPPASTPSSPISRPSSSISRGEAPTVPRVAPPSSVPTPRERIRVSPPVSPGNSPSIITRPANPVPSRPNFESGGSRRIESPHSPPPTRVEPSRSAPSRSEPAPRSGGGGNNNNNGGGRGRGRD